MVVKCLCFLLLDSEPPAEVSHGNSDYTLYANSRKKEYFALARKYRLMGSFYYSPLKEEDAEERVVVRHYNEEDFVMPCSDMNAIASYVFFFLIISCPIKFSFVNYNSLYALPMHLVA